MDAWKNSPGCPEGSLVLSALVSVLLSVSQFCLSWEASVLRQRWQHCSRHIRHGTADGMLGSSHSRSGPRVRSIMRQRELTPTAGQLVGALAGVRVLVISTSGSAGRPPSSAVGGHFLGGDGWCRRAGMPSRREPSPRAHRSASPSGPSAVRRIRTGAARAQWPGAFGQGAWIERHLTAHHGISLTTFRPDVVFARVQPSWTVSYGEDPSALADISECGGPESASRSPISESRGSHNRHRSAIRSREPRS